MTGLLLSNGCRVTHGTAATIKTPFDDLPLIMHELSPGGDAAFSGQFGFIPFSSAIRLPRHVHIGAADASGRRSLLAERILVLNGSGLAELNGVVHLAAPGTLFDIAPGVPHSWTACPAGVRLPDGSVTDGQFLMVYAYAAPTGFYPTSATATLTSLDDYVAHEGAYDPIRIPATSAGDVAATCRCVWNGREIFLDSDAGAER